MLNKRNFCHVVIVCDHVVVRVKYTYFRMKISYGFYSHHDLDYCSLFFVSFGTPLITPKVKLLKKQKTLFVKIWLDLSPHYMYCELKNAFNILFPGGNSFSCPVFPVFRVAWRLGCVWVILYTSQNAKTDSLTIPAGRKMGSLMSKYV